MMGVTRAIGDAVSQALVFGKSFKDAFGNAARQVVGQLVSSLVQIGVKMLLNATIGKALQTASTATSVMVANTIAGAYATPAALVSLATAGANAVPAQVGIASTVILSNALASLGISGRKLGGRMNQDQPYLVGEAGPELVVPDRASNVVPNGQLGGMGKQVNVNFNITTVDATGFSELLVNSRATIVNVINQALNEKGKEVLV
jgi:SLT domain-containing protein